MDKIHPLVTPLYITMLIYIIRNNVNNKVYIGQTTKSLEERWKGHLSQCRSGQPFHLYRAMRKYGIDNFYPEILVDNIRSRDELNQLEQYYIDKFDSVANGYNMALGGYVNVMSQPEIKEHHDNVMRSDNVRNKISKTVKQNIANGQITDEYRAKMSNIAKDRYNSPQGEIAKEKFRKSYVFTPEHQAAANAGRYKGVYCINESGQEVARFDKVKDAAEWWYYNGYNNVNSSNQLCDWIKKSYKENKFIKGLKWIYLKKGDKR